MTIIRAIFSTLLALLVQGTGASPEGKDFIKNINRYFPEITEIKDYIKGTKTTPSLTIVCFYSFSNCEKCKSQEESMIELHDRYGKMVRFAKYNCDKIKDESNFDGIRQCRDNYEKNNFPNFYFFLPSENTFYPYDPQTFNFPKSKPRSSTPDGMDEMLQ